MIRRNTNEITKEGYSKTNYKAKVKYNAPFTERRVLPSPTYRYTHGNISTSLSPVRCLIFSFFYNFLWGAFSCSSLVHPCAFYRDQMCPMADALYKKINVNNNFHNI